MSNLREDCLTSASVSDLLQCHFVLRGYSHLAFSDNSDTIF